MSRSVSNPAQVATEIRAEMRSRGVDGRVTSDASNNEGSVDVYMIDALPAAGKEIADFAKRYSLKSRCSKALFVVNDVFIHREYSHELKVAAWEYVKSNYSLTSASGVSVKESEVDIRNAYLDDVPATTIARKVLTGEEVSSFWSMYKSREVLSECSE